MLLEATVVILKFVIPELTTVQLVPPFV